MVKVLKNNLSIYVAWLCMLFCISIGVVTTSILSIIALIIFVTFLLIYPTINSCVLLFGIMPFANIFKYGAGSTSFFTICELLLVFVAIFREKKIKSSLFALLVVLAIYIVFLDIPNLNILGVLKIILGFYFLYILTSKATKDSVINIAYLLAASIILMMLLSMNNSYFKYVEPYFSDLDYLLDETGHASDTLRMSGFIGDPNYCGMLIVMSIALLCVLYFYKKIKNEFWLFIVFLIPLGFFTYSKSYFLCVSVLVFFLIVTVLIPKHKIWGLISIFAVAIVISMALSGKIEIINTILERFLADDITTGRSDLNNYYLHYIWNNPMTLIFGEGMSADRIVSAGNNVHNFYIDAVFKFGLVGCLIFILTLCSSIGFTIDKKEKRKFVNYIPLIFLVVLYFALAGITRYELPFYVAIVFLSINFNSLNEDKTKERTLLKEIKENE